MKVLYLEREQLWLKVRLFGEYVSDVACHVAAKRQQPKETT